MSSKLPNLQGLLQLARKDGVDVRPTLIRVLTDLFVQDTSPTQGGIHRFIELGGRLLDSADDDTRRAVSEKLSGCGHAPHLIVMRLANDTLHVAAPLLAKSPVLTDSDLMTLIETKGTPWASVIAERRELSPRVAALLADITDASVEKALGMISDITGENFPIMPEAEVDDAPSVVPELRGSFGGSLFDTFEEDMRQDLSRLDAVDALQSDVLAQTPLYNLNDRHGLDPIAALQHAAAAEPETAVELSSGAVPWQRSGVQSRVLARDDIPANALAPAFLEASREERERILKGMQSTRDYRSVPEAQSVALWQSGRDHVWQRLEATALSRRPVEFRREIEQALGISETIAQRIVADPSGEPIIVAMKVLEVPRDIVMRIMLFLNPSVGRSVERVFSLIELFDALDLNVAQRLAVHWHRASAPKFAEAVREKAVHQPVHITAQREQLGARDAAIPRLDAGKAPQPMRRLVVRQ